MKSTAIALGIFSLFSFSTFAHNGEDDEKKPATSTTEKKSTVEYRIQLVSSADELSDEMKQQLEELGNTIQMNSKGKQVYLTQEFATEEEAAAFLPELRDKGFKNAMQVVLVEDYVIPARTYHFFYDKKKVGEEEKTKLFTPEIKIIKE